MKVICIEEKLDLFGRRLLTLSRIYYLISARSGLYNPSDSISNKNSCTVVADDGKVWWCNKRNFKPIEDIRNEKLDELGI